MKKGKCVRSVKRGNEENKEHWSGGHEHTQQKEKKMRIEMVYSRYDDVMRRSFQERQKRFNK